MAAAAAALLAGAPAAAQERERELPEIVQDVFLAETQYAQEKGLTQATLDARVGAEGWGPRLLLEYGITDRFQLSLLTRPLLHSSLMEPESFRGGALYAIIPDASPIALSLELQAGPARVEGETDGGPGVGDTPRRLRLARMGPSPDGGGDAPGPGGTRMEWEPAAIAAWRAGSLQVHGSIAATVARRARTRMSYAAVGLLDGGRLSPTLELVSEANDWGRETRVVPGAFIHFARQVEAGVGLPMCLSCDAPHPELRAMLTVEF